MTIFDVVVIGGGIVGCSILDNLTDAGYKCHLVEKREHLVQGASSGNRYHKLRNVEHF